MGLRIRGPATSWQLTCWPGTVLRHRDFGGNARASAGSFQFGCSDETLKDPRQICRRLFRVAVRFLHALALSKGTGNSSTTVRYHASRSCSEGSLGPYPGGQRDSSHLAIRCDGGSWTSIGDRLQWADSSRRRPSALGLVGTNDRLSDVEIATVTGSGRPEAELPEPHVGSSKADAPHIGGKGQRKEVPLFRAPHGTGR